MRQAGLAPWEIRPDRPCLDFAAERAFAAELLRREDRPTAMLCYFSIFVPALVHAACELGVKIPRDLSIITFAPENYREQALMVSAMIEPHYVMGQQAVRALCDKIERPTKYPSVRELDFGWCDMGTCVEPPAK